VKFWRYFALGLIIGWVFPDWPGANWFVQLVVQVVVITLVVMIISGTTVAIRNHRARKALRKWTLDD
jgi:Na+/H+-dicarboxylate symporter